MTRCCYYGGYSQENEFSIVSYDLYKHLRDNTNGFAELAAFQAGGSTFGVLRTGDSESAQSNQGELVTGNYFNMFCVSAYAGRMLNARDDWAGAQGFRSLAASLIRKSEQLDFAPGSSAIGVVAAGVNCFEGNALTRDSLSSP